MGTHLNPPLVLGSASPRRLDLLRSLGLEPDRVLGADLDETPGPRELPAAHARRLADEKCRAVAAQAPDALVLAADTVVACGRRILPKAEDPATARDCLLRLGGRRHRVLTAIALRAPDGRRAAKLVVTTVRFKRLTRAETDWYLATEEWRGKAGGYAIQGAAAAFVASLNGSWSAVVGLPLHETAMALEGLGYRVSGHGA